MVSKSRISKSEKQSEIESFGNWVIGKEIANNVKGENFVGFSMQMKKKGRQRVKGYWFTESFGRKRLFKEQRRDEKRTNVLWSLRRRSNQVPPYIYC